MTAVTNSAAGKDIHTPVISQSLAKRKAIGIIKISPRRKEMIWAGNAFSTEVKYMERMILNPAKTRDVKYSLKPVTAIVCKVALFSLLKADAIGSANTNKIR